MVPWLCGLLALAVLGVPVPFFWSKCCTCEAEVTVRLTGCNGSGLDGETVTIKQGGSTVATGTTGGGGYVAFMLLVGSYTAHAPSVTGFMPLSAASFNVAAGCAPVSVALAMAVDSDNYVCCPTRARPIPMDLTYTDANGSIAATYVDAGTRKFWQVCYAVSKSGILTDDSGIPRNCTGTTTADVAVQATLECTASYMRASLVYSVKSCLSGPFLSCSLAPTDCVEVDGVPTSGGGIQVFPSSASNDLPTSFTGTWPTFFGTCDIPGNVPTPVSGSFTWAP